MKTRTALKLCGLNLEFDESRSVEHAISHLFRQAEDLQKQGGGSNYVGALLQHLVGAKLDMVLGEGKVSHHGSSVADGPTARSGDFEIGTQAIEEERRWLIYLTSMKGQWLVARKCWGRAFTLFLRIPVLF